MSDNPFLISEYRTIWEALKQYEKYLENRSLSACNEAEELKYDEKLQNVMNTRKSVQYSALDQYGLELK